MTAHECPLCGAWCAQPYKLPYHQDAVCWECHCQRLGANGLAVLEPGRTCEQCLTDDDEVQQDRAGVWLCFDCWVIKEQQLLEALR